MEHFAAIIDALAHAILAGEQAEDAIVERCALTVGKRWRWLRSLARRYLDTFGAARTRRREVVDFLSQDRGFRRAWSLYSAEFSAAPRLLPPPAMLGNWNVPAIVTPGDLADWLALYSSELDWFADLKNLGTRPKLCHYYYRVLDKGGGAIRVI